MSDFSKNVISKEEAEKIVKECYSIADFCRKVGWQPRGDNYKVFHKYVKQYNLDTSHFTGKRTNLGNLLNVGISKEEFFKKDKLIKAYDIRKKIFKEGLKENKCEICGLTEWLNNPIQLQIHHIDGDHMNNEIENIQLLCPNCHSQTENFAGKKNKKNKCTHTHKRQRKHICSICGKALHRPPKTGMCAECLRKTYKNK